MTVYLVISLPKISYTHRIHMVLANNNVTPPWPYSMPCSRDNSCTHS